MRYGVFGGVFNPFHTEHMRIIEHALSNCDIDKVLIVPSYNPPHKDLISKFEDRVSIINTYIKDDERIIVDTIEKELKLDNSYTYIILEEIIKRYGNDIVFIVGGDSLINLNKWMKPKKIAALAPFLVYSRGNRDLLSAKKFAEKEYNATIELLDIELANISSTYIRMLFEMGDKYATKYLNNEAVELIIKNDMYNKYRSTIMKLRRDLSSKTIIHSFSCAKYAMQLALDLNEDLEKVFLASILHDCAKNDDWTSQYEGINSSVIHQYTSADKAEKIYDIKDKEVLDAIRYHTTAKPNMSMIGKIVYVADKIELNRNFEGVELLRSAVEKDFFDGFKEIINHNLQFLKNNGQNIDKLTEIAATCYNIC